MSAYPHLQTLYQNTLALSELEPNWDGGFCQKVEPSAIYKTLQLLEAIAISLAPASVEPLTNGRVQLRWTNHKADLLLEVIPNRDRAVYQIVSLDVSIASPARELNGMQELLEVLVEFKGLVKRSAPSRTLERPYQTGMNLPHPL